MHTRETTVQYLGFEITARTLGDSPPYAGDYVARPYDLTDFSTHITGETEPKFDDVQRALIAGIDAAKAAIDRARGRS